MTETPAEYGSDEEMNKPLKPCPFCGGKAVLWPAWKNDALGMEYNAYISCSGCPVRMGQPLGDLTWRTKNVVLLWNWRTEQ